VYGGGETSPDGALDMLCIPTLVEIATVPVDKIEDELSGLTSSQGLATRWTGAHESCDSAGPRNRHDT
jgi:hypothetical protein